MSSSNVMNGHSASKCKYSDKWRLVFDFSALQTTQYLFEKNFPKNSHTKQFKNFIMLKILHKSNYKKESPVRLYHTVYIAHRRNASLQI